MGSQPARNRVASCVLRVVEYMREIKRILCPADFSEASAHAIELAVALAARRKARITALHVHPPADTPLPGVPLLEEAGEAELSRVRTETAACFRAATDAGIDVDVVVDVGQPAARILVRAAALPADVIVIGTHGASGFRHLALGSVTEKVLRTANCAVLTVPPRAQATSTLPFAHVMCPVDFSEPSLAALKVARSLASELASTLTVLHVIEWPRREAPAQGAAELPPAQAETLVDYRRYVEKRAMTRLEGLVEDAVADRLAPVLCTRHGQPHVEILRMSAEERAGLIVIGVHGRNVVEMTLFGSTTNHVVRQATCPVFTVRQ
jgi:nucleotide-binding universal stress UspA family protein